LLCAWEEGDGAGQGEDLNRYIDAVFFVLQEER
jgi:hypothetical protein